MNRGEVELEFLDGIEGETDNAVKVSENGEAVWIPLSQISKITRHPGGTASITMSRWIADKKGLL